MSSIAAQRLAWVVDTAETIVAIELLIACQAIDLRQKKPGPAMRALHGRVRERVPPMIDDRVIADDIEAVKALVQSGAVG